MKTVSITLVSDLLPVKATDGYTKVSKEYIEEHGLDSQAIAVVDDEPESLHKELFGYPAETWYYIPEETYNRIFDEMYPPESEEKKDWSVWAGV